MVKKRRRHTAAFKFRVALEAPDGSKTMSRLFIVREIHTVLIRARNQYLLNDGPRSSISMADRLKVPTMTLQAKQHYALRFEPTESGGMHLILPFSRSSF